MNDPAPIIRIHVLDLFARRMVGWAISSSSIIELAVKALDNAGERHWHLSKIMFHSDSNTVGPRLVYP